MISIALGGSKLNDSVLQSAFVTHRQALGRPNFKGKPVVIHDLYDQRPLARKPSNSIQYLGQEPLP